MSYGGPDDSTRRVPQGGPSPYAGGARPYGEAPAQQGDAPEYGDRPGYADPYGPSYGGPAAGYGATGAGSTTEPYGVQDRSGYAGADGTRQQWPAQNGAAQPYPGQPYAAQTYPPQAPAPAYPAQAYPEAPYATQVRTAALPTPAPPTSPPTPPAGTPSPRERRRGWRSPAFLVPAVIGVVLVLAAAATVVVVKLRGVQVEAAPSGTPTATGKAASMPPGRTWLSGAWTGSGISTKLIGSFGDWRGQAADVVTTYPEYDTWDALKGSDWHVGTLDGFKGRLSYGLPLLPKKEQATLGDVAAGKHDDAFKAVAQTLLKHDRGDAFVRIGWEGNGTWFPWGATADRAEHYKAAWRHVRSVMKAVAPNLVFGFDITCGKALEGGKDRLDALNKLYPGDDVVDVVGCDHYDSYQMKSRNAGEWKRTLQPPDSPGLADVAAFARSHGKRLSVPEWGLSSPKNSGAGDNPFFIYSMYQFFQQNKDILAYEDYFNEPDDSQGSAIWSKGSEANPQAAAEYKKLWGAAPTLVAPSS